MPSTRRRNDILARRRRTEDDGEDDGSVLAGNLDDSQSEASVLSGNEDDGDADDSDLSGPDGPDSASQKPGKPRRRGGSQETGRQPATVHKSASAPTIKSPQDSEFPTMKDTTTMMNGLSIDDSKAAGESLDFDSLEGKAQQQPVLIGGDVPTTATEEVKSQENLGDRRRREHEEYRKKRDTDPAFTPNRGAFFMHDHRSAGPGQNGFRPFGRGRGRGGRGGAAIGGPFSPANIIAQPSEITSNPWTHDLHESINEAPARSAARAGGPSVSQNTDGLAAGGPPSSVMPSTAMPPPSSLPGPTKPVSTLAKPPPVRSFNTTKLLAKATGRISLPGMKEPRPFTVSIQLYAKLPNHRPPLRRDKPVRVSLPNHPPRYIFPSVERSFIFIPRALRPNQSMGRGRGRGVGSIAGYSSRRTSMHGGSIYSPSVAMSRRSSIARDFNRDSLVSPHGMMNATGRPMIRLPAGSQQGSAGVTPTHSGFASGIHTPTSAVVPNFIYPLPQKPTYHENLPANMTMHQPRPQKQVSVTDIEPPASMAQSVEEQQQLPFHQQMPPPHMNGQVPVQPGMDYYNPQDPALAQGGAGGPQHPPMPHSSATTSNNFSHHAVHAQPFQPYQAPAYPQSMYYYPPANPQYMYMPSGQMQAGYMMHPPPMAPTDPSSGGVTAQQQTTEAPQMVPYEQNGMVYYYDASQVPVSGVVAAPSGPEGMMAAAGGYPIMSSAAPVPVDGYYYPAMAAGPVYYPQQ